MENLIARFASVKQRSDDDGPRSHSGSSGRSSRAADPDSDAVFNWLSHATSDESNKLCIPARSASTGTPANDSFVSPCTPRSSRWCGAARRTRGAARHRRGSTLGGQRAHHSPLDRAWRAGPRHRPRFRPHRGTAVLESSCPATEEPCGKAPIRHVLEWAREHRSPDRRGGGRAATTPRRARHRPSIPLVRRFPPGRNRRPRGCHCSRGSAG